ncbi:MAG: hypothetical protein JWP91_1025 [Fibrobacteres bacterium]|nr:hypothetical protein [Fibrobacterota bacterium]
MPAILVMIAMSAACLGAFPGAAGAMAAKTATVAKAGASKPVTAAVPPSGKPASAEAPQGCAVPAILSLLGEGDFGKALMEAESCKGTREYARLKGQSFHGLFQADSAVFYLRQAMANGQDDAVKVTLAEALIWKKETKEALRLLESVQDKGTPSYYKAMAARYEAERKFPKALEMYDKALSMEKVSFGTRFRKAMLLSWMKKLDASVSLYTELIDSPGTPPSFKSRCVIRRAEVRSWNHEMDKAAAELTALLAKEPANGEAHLQLGQVLEWQGKYKDAKGQYRDALVADPESAAAKAKLEELLWVK